MGPKLLEVPPDDDEAPMTTTARSPQGRPGGRTSRVLVAAGLSVLVAVALAALLGALLDGRPAALGALVGGAVALGFFLFGSSVVNAATRMAPEAALLIALTTYALQVVLVAVVFVGIDRSGAVGDSLSGGWLVGGLVAATVAWTAGQLVFSSRARVPVYDVELPSSGPSAAPFTDPTDTTPDHRPAAGSHGREAGAS
jgi:ATP synthase protein I